MICKKNKQCLAFIIGALLSGSLHAEEQVFFDKNSSAILTSIEGGANWSEDSIAGAFNYNNNGELASHRAMIYSTESYQSNDGFRLTIEYKAGSLSNLNSHNFSFGLISDDTDLSSYHGSNPFAATQSVYSIGANLTSDNGTSARGLNFTDGSKRVTLDESGTRVQFAIGQTTKVTIEVGIGGYWSYRINDEFEADGVLAEGFDLSKSYRVAVYGQDDQGGEKSIQSITLKKAYAAGERAASIRGEWFGGEGDVESVKHFKTLDTMKASFTNGASLSAVHSAPQKLLERIALYGADGNGPAIDLIAPTWGDLSLDEPESDPFLEQVLAIKAAGFKVKAYTNSENFVGSNGAELQEFVDRWKAYCDTDPEIQAFINSQPFHTGIWDRDLQTYVDASDTYPNRKYMFVYAEYILKDQALRYGKHFGSWIFDDGDTMAQNGDKATSGIIEEQRIYQAYANAVHAGNPETPIAFNNGRSTVNYDSFPFAHAVRFEDFTFGHAFGGNNDHASKTGSQFNNNYKHVTRMTETDGYVHAGGAWEWDDKIVGNMHSKLSTSAWKYGPTQAWEEADFYQWNLEALQAGGHMTWGGSTPRTSETLYGWAYTLLKGLDDHLAKYQNPGSPDWARYATILPDAHIGQPYTHTLQNNIDFWDPEGDGVTLELLDAEDDAPSWLTLTEDQDNPGAWILSGIPSETVETVFTFKLRVAAYDGEKERTVTLNLTEGTSPYPFSGNTAIFALPNTDYGVDNVVTMESSVLTAPDGLATFQIAIDLTPAAGSNINSSETSWGIGENSQFAGFEGSTVDSIDNLRLINFNAKGGKLHEDNFVHLSFENLDIVNASNRWDRVRVTTNGIQNSSNGSKGSGLLDLRYAGEEDLTHLILDTGTNGAGSNVWQVNSIGVSYIVEQNDTVDGDLDGDGALTRDDMLMFRSALGSSVGDGAYNDAADLDNDGAITRSDYSIWLGLYRNQ
ncbi:MAG: dockerin type I repeat-containing protein [Thalassotalea sp.]